MNITFNRYAERLAKLDDLYLSIQKISGFTVEQLLDMFMAGYEMSPPKYGTISQLMPEDIGTKKKEVPTMQVTYNGFTGDLVKLELRTRVEPGANRYDLSIYDSEKRATISFTGVKIKDLRFHSGEVTFGG